MITILSLHSICSESENRKAKFYVYAKYIILNSLVSVVLSNINCEIIGVCVLKLDCQFIILYLR